MNRRTLVALSTGLLVIATACHKNPPPTPAPTTQPSNPQPQQPTQRPTPVDQGVRTPPDNNKAIEDAFNGRVKMMSEKIHFDYNESAVRAEDNARLDGKASLLKQFPTLKIRITGHADERGSDQYNIALGKRRADAAKDYLVRAGIDASRIETSSLGREVPENPGHDETAWSQNRRDEFDIIAGTQTMRVP